VLRAGIGALHAGFREHQQLRVDGEVERAQQGSEIPAAWLALKAASVLPQRVTQLRHAIRRRPGGVLDAGMLVQGSDPGVVLLAALVVGGLYLFGGGRKLTFKAYVDGTDIVHLSGRALWIEHLEWQPPNKITINGKKWNPTWSDNNSERHYLGWFFHLGSPKDIKISKRLGRGTVALMEMPSAANQETLSIKVDDGPYGGADWYEFTVTW
jgi:hypothetical protein